MPDLGRYLVQPGTSIRQTMLGLTDTRGLAIVVDPDRKLLGTVTDGDIRRAILAGANLDQPVETLLSQERVPEHAKPLTAPAGTAEPTLLQMMKDLDVRHIPLVDSNGRVADVAVLEDMLRDDKLPMSAMIMAGGYGERLRPLTEDIPKPMLPLGDRPLLEHIVDQLRDAGVRDVNITTHYKGDVISDHFQDGAEFGVNIQYVDEEKPLGTAGALSLMETSEEPLLVINGDIVTKVDLRAMLYYHTEHRADMTVALRHHEYQVPFGVVDIDGVKIADLREKPTERFLINAGIYLIAPSARGMVPTGRRYDMTDLIVDLIAGGKRVVGFPVPEYWLDVGQMADYEKAQAQIGGESAQI